MAIYGIGTDLCENKRLENILSGNKERFVKKVFTTDEIACCNSKSTAAMCFAARFAAKEAFLKALGTGLRNGIRWKDVEVVLDNLGKPSFRFQGNAANKMLGKKAYLTMSHSTENSVAFVIIEDAL